MPEAIVKKKVAVVGSRNFADKRRLYDVMTKNFDRIKLVISGGARGADTLAVEWAADYGIPYLVFPALWRDPFTGVQNKGAGFKRNRQIVEQADVVVAFWDGKSAGTKHTIDMATEMGKPVRIIKFVVPPPPTEPPMLGVKGVQKVAVEPDPKGSLCCSMPTCEHQESSEPLSQMPPCCALIAEDPEAARELLAIPAKSTPEKPEVPFKDDIL